MSDVIRCPYCLKFIDGTITPTECIKCGNSLTQAQVDDGSKDHVEASEFIVDSLIPRFLAQVIDLVVIFTGIMLTAFAIDSFISKDSPVSWILILVSCFVMIVLYPSITEYTFGATLGKRIGGIRVVDEMSLGRLRFTQAIKRNIYKTLILGGLIVVSMILGGIPFIFALFYPDIWSQHNKLSSVVEVYS